MTLDFCSSDRHNSGSAVVGGSVTGAAEASDADGSRLLRKSSGLNELFDSVGAGGVSGGLMEISCAVGGDGGATVVESSVRTSTGELVGMVPRGAAVVDGVDDKVVRARLTDEDPRADGDAVVAGTVLAAAGVDVGMCVVVDGSHGAAVVTFWPV